MYPQDDLHPNNDEDQDLTIFEISASSGAEQTSRVTVTWRGYLAFSYSLKGLYCALVVAISVKRERA